MEKKIKILTVEEFKELLKKENNEKGKEIATVNDSGISSSRQSTNEERIIALENKVGVLEEENERLKKEMTEIKQTLQLVLELQLNQDNESFSKKTVNTENKAEAFIVQSPKMPSGPEN